MEYKKVCFMYRHEDYVVDGIRSALGLAVENMYSYGVVIDKEIPEIDELTKESIEMLRDMEGDIFTTVQADVEKNDFTAISIEELGEKLREMTHIIPYGAK
ncbi:MAG: hypothetical protein BA862_06575 [Desulfobulbaceae bacterium S3730MH12]|nr:MAG: hypothetical protein BA866_08105 [Desulfobulbaceae bacterium S5133MH15]OEU55201.1 MAG: hypothetical protein BA862_06575 [Desulfobulbaceae bacterium S3730MH12]OEU78694.1 MAG: hypothetical protein BA873_01010 [Desulfobulbaceae bacterium C00003063]